jgi:phosphoadenosine phosphosulfate reductase
VATAPLSGDLTSEEVASLAEHFEPLRAEELVEFASETFGGRLVLTCSWQLGTSILVHMTRQVAPETRLVEIDTGLLFPETHAARERLVDHYGLEVETLRPLQSVSEQAATHGDALWARDPDRCCGLRKVSPL